LQIFQLVPIDQRLNLLKVLADAKPAIQVVVFGLALAVLTSVAVWAVLAAGRRTEDVVRKGLAFLSAVLVAAPLFGLTAAVYDLLDISIGIANTRPEANLIALAPGFAEVSLCVLLGLLAASLAAAFRAHLRLSADGASAA
jgi:hypothetical protein